MVVRAPEQPTREDLEANRQMTQVSTDVMVWSHLSCQDVQQTHKQTNKQTNEGHVFADISIISCDLTYEYFWWHLIKPVTKEFDFNFIILWMSAEGEGEGEGAVYTFQDFGLLW